jgi:hypothetical protein
VRLKFQSIGYFGTGSGDPLPDPAPSGIRIIPVSGFPDSGKSGGTGCCRIVQDPAEPDSEPDSGTPLQSTAIFFESSVKRYLDAFGSFQF